MDYEKKYKELVAKIKNAHLYAQTDSTKNVLEGILPELAESEDERILEIIKHCIESRYLHTSTIKGISQKQCFAWLEKQGGQKSQRMVSAEAKEAMYDKPAWSIEDMSKVQRICKYLDEAKKYYADITEVRECMNWLKSLRPQNHWRPSDEQIKALHDLNLTGNISYAGQGQVLIELYNDLKKLREE